MARRGRSPSPPPVSRRTMATAPPARAAAPPAAKPTPAPAAASTPAPVAPQASAVGSPVQASQPSMFQQMAATAGGVAVGSAIGHTVGHAVTGLFSGGSDKAEAAPAPAAQPAYQQPAYQQSQQPQTGPCSWEIKQFLQCAENQHDLSLCQGFNEAMRQCKTANNMM